ncbi:MAG: NADP-dependent oxidoreductase [Alphaproteobacteria bacterium]|nr:NADP-dependent oxidoreductase [Alphaproteobacteria bacterium]MBU1516390.1 NADP-dependent oxidoreductase [Alphaproteobacteria bacterium]MBU2093373.1 NADP-dependent oxidoreductase [Alphaproteobacteria bacterium]MBU2153860.1 NADP-dependent oxidoreductase [Alphaproteobacteria bacterium]MBU2307732.1 NADP-dependent oxidoreductase [Alphaproteobacteria bacterium]
MRTTRQWVLDRRPEGRVADADVRLVEVPLPPLEDGAFELEHIHLSIDPTNRLWMSDTAQAAMPIQLGRPVRAFVYGRVTASRHPDFRDGDMVRGLASWSDRSVLRAGALIPRRRGMPLSAHASILGMTGLTAYFGVTEIGRPAAGETFVVSAAAGATGSIAGQIARLLGARTIGIVGGEAKARRLVSRFGFDAGVDRRGPDLLEALRAACPNGVDVDFENAGGVILDTVLKLINPGARIVLCGMISGYEATGGWPTNDLSQILMKRARLEGLLVSAFADRYEEATSRLADWALAGQIAWDVDISHGLESAPSALARVLAGRSEGKQLVQLAPDPWDEAA